MTLFSLALYGPEDYYSADEALAMLTRQKALNFTPGSQKLDYNSGYFLMSILVKRASGKTLRQFANERIFQPLAMTNTHYHDDHREPIAKRATGYRKRNSGEGFDILTSEADTIGDRGLYTSINDLLKWERNVHNLTAPSEFGLQSFKYQGLEAVTYRSPWDDWAGQPFNTQPWTLRGFRADLLRFPTERTSILCLCNHAKADPSWHTESIADVILQSKLDGTPFGRPGAIGDYAVGPQSPASDYPGRFHSKELEVVYELAVSGANGLRIEHRNGRVLTQFKADFFAGEDMVLEFQRDANRVTGFTLSSGRIQGIRFDRIP